MITNVIFHNAVSSLAAGAACGLAMGLFWRKVNSVTLASRKNVFFAVWTAGVFARLIIVVAALVALAGRGVNCALAFTAAMALVQSALLAIPMKTVEIDAR